MFFIGDGVVDLKHLMVWFFGEQGKKKPLKLLFQRLFLSVSHFY